MPHKDASQHVKAVTSLKVTRKELFRCYRNLEMSNLVFEKPLYSAQSLENLWNPK